MQPSNVPDLTARQLHAVLAVAEYNSFIAAAAFLRTSQPALTRTIKRVEDVLGVRLFDRSTRRVAITPAGKEFVAVAERMLNDLRISISSMREIGEEQRGQIIISSIMSVANGLLPAIVAKYRATRPGIEIILREGVHGTVLEDIRSGTADLGATYVDDVPDFVTAKRVNREVFGVILPRAHPLSKTAKSSVTLADVLDLPMVSLPHESRTRRIVDAAAAAAGRTLHHVATVTTREVLAINMVMAGCKPEYAGVVRAAMLALTQLPFNLNGVQATTHVASPLLIVNGPVAREIGMNGSANAFGSGNRANATIGRAVRLIMLNVGGGRAPDLDKCTLGNPAKYTYCVCENEEHSPLAPYHVEHGYAPNRSTVFAMAAEAPHSVTDHHCNDSEGILDTVCSAMSTMASNTAVLSGHCAVVLGLEHAHTIAEHGWTRNDIKSYLWLNSGNRFDALSRGHRYGRVYNRNLPKWYKRDPDSRIPIVEGPDRIHLFVIGGRAGRFSAFIPGWGHMSTPVLQPIAATAMESGGACADGMCKL